MGKICILLPAHWNAMKGGAEYQADIFAKYLSVSGKYQITYLAKYIDESNTSNDYEITKIDSFVSNIRYGLFWDSFSLYKNLSRIDPDVVLQHVGCSYTGIAAYFCKKKRKSLVWYLASDIDVSKTLVPTSIKRSAEFIDNLIQRYGLRNANKIVAQTQKQANMLSDNFNIVADEIIPNFHEISIKKFEKSKQFTVIWVANLKRLKQPEIFIQLAKDCSIKSNIVFKLVGRKESSNWCKELLREIEQLSNIEYLGELEIEEVNALMEFSQILVNTSIYEGFPNTFIQAWMREVLTLSLNVDPDDVIKNNEIGLHAGNYEKMIEYIIEMSERPEKILQMGRKARIYAEKNYSMKNADRLVSLIDSELGQLN